MASFGARCLDRAHRTFSTHALMELEDVDCQSALFSLTCGVLGHGLNVPHHLVFAVIVSMFRITLDVIHKLFIASFLGKTKRVMTLSHTHTYPLSFLVARACEVVCGVKEVVELHVRQSGVP